MKRPIFYLLLAYILLQLAACRSSKLPQYTEAEKQAQRESISYWQPDTARRLTPDQARWYQVDPADTTPQLHRPPLVDQPVVAAPDSLPFVTVERKSVLDKLLHRPPKVTIYPGFVPVKAGKKSTVNIYNAPATVTTAGKKATVAAGDGATVVRAAKKAGPVVIADSGAAVQVATTKKGPAAAGQGIKQEEVAKPSFLDSLKPFGMMIGTVAAVGTGLWLWFGGGAWIVGLLKRKKSTDSTQA